MKVIHVTPSLSPSSGGPAYSIPKLCEGLINLGNKVDLLALDLGEEPLISTPYRLFAQKAWPKLLRRSPDMWAWIKQSIQTDMPQIIHSHNLWGMPSIYPFIAQKRWGVLHVVSPRGTLTEYSMSIGSKLKSVYWSIIQSPALKQAVGIHATAADELEDIRRLGFRQPVALIPNGVDLPLLSITGTRPNVLLYLGRIHPEKGLLNLLKAWSKIQSARGNWVLRIVGPDTVGYKSVLLEFISRNVVQGVVIENAVYGDAKYDIYRQAAIFVLPSPTENFGMSVAESLSVGTPAIANKGAPWQGLNDNKCGWWVDSGVEALAAAIVEAMHTTPAVRAMMGENGRRWIDTAFNWSGISLKMEGFYKYLLSGGPRPDYVDL